MARTTAQIKQQVAEDLGLVAIGQGVEAQHAQRIEDAYDQLLARLDKQELLTFAKINGVPDELAPYIVLMICEKLLTAFPVSESRYVRIKSEAGNDGQIALKAFEELSNDTYVSDQDFTDY